MNRRGFLSMLGGAVAGIALEQAIPLGRVWSFPSRIVVGNWEEDDDLERGVGMYPPGISASIVALQLEKVRAMIPVFYRNDRALFALIGSPEPVRITARMPVRITARISS